MEAIFCVGTMWRMTKKVTPRLKAEKPRYFFKQWRKHRLLTQEALADRLGMSTSSVSQIETGKQGFTDATLEAIADALSCTPGDLLMRNPSDSDAVWSIHEKLSKASPEIRRQAIAVMETILKTGT